MSNDNIVWRAVVAVIVW